MIHNRKILTVAALCFLIFHVLISLRFNFPSTEKQGILHSIVFRYMFPVFNQNNKVFAPDPPFLSQYMLLHTYRKGTRISIDPGEQYRRNLLRVPFSPSLYPLRAYEYRMAKLYTVYAYADYLASRQIEREKKAYNKDSLRNTILVKDSLYMVELDRCAKEAGLKEIMDSCRIGLYFVYHPAFKKFLEGKRTNSVLSYEFPMVNHE